LPSGVYIRTEEHLKKMRENSCLFKEGHQINVGRVCSEETKIKIGNTKRGKHPSDEARLNMSIAKKGIPFSEEHKQKISDALKGNNNPNWMGGEKLRVARANNKRRNLGHLFINEPFEDSEGHHIDSDNILYIPKDLHRSICHNLTTGYNMELINLKAMEWIILLFKKYTGDE